MQITDGRSTLRCLRSDLDNDWDDSSHHGMVSSGAISVPLPELNHPIVRKVAADFSADAGEADVARENISGLSDPPWWKVKIGSRWRGAAWVDPETGQAWLCAAGYRFEGESKDFYKQFMAGVAAHGPGAFLPTVEDRGRLADELTDARLRKWETELADLARAATLDNILGGAAALEIHVPGVGDAVLAEATITVVAEQLDGEDLLDIVVEFRFGDYAQMALAQWAELVVLTAIDPREQRWTSMPIDGMPAHSQMLEGQEIREWLTLIEEGVDPGIVLPGDVSHYAHRQRLTQSTIEGEAVKSVCGVWFVPRQDHQGLNTCPYCSAVMRIMPGADEAM